MVTESVSQNSLESKLRPQWLVAFLLVAFMSGTAAATLWYLHQPTSQPFRVVNIVGELRHLPRATLERTIADALRGGFFSADLRRLQRALLTLPWVAEVRLRRIWPDQLELEVNEETALASWGDRGLVTPRGRVLYPEPDTRPKGLATLIGPDDESAATLVARFRELRALLQPVGLEIGVLRLDARGSWSLRLGNRLELALGKVGVAKRLTRFLRLYPQLQAIGVPERADLRYGNGFAIRWQSLTNNGRVTALSG